MTDIAITDMDSVEAHDITKRIKASVEATWMLLFEAHERRAWRALGYASWGDYIKVEFDISRARSYQLIDRAKVIQAIDSVSTDVDSAHVITEAVARDIKPVLPEILAEAKSLIAGLDALREGDADQVVRDVVEAKRTDLAAMRAAIKTGPKVPTRKPSSVELGLDLVGKLRKIHRTVAEVVELTADADTLIVEGQVSPFLAELDYLENAIGIMRSSLSAGPISTEVEQFLEDTE